MTTKLPKFSVQRARNLLPQQKWNDLASGLLTELDYLLQCSDREFAVAATDVKEFVNLFLAEAARETMTGDMTKKSIRGTDYALQDRVFQLTHRLSGSQSSGVRLDEVTLLNLTVACRDDHGRDIARTTIENTAASDPHLGQGILSTIQPILTQPFNEGHDPGTFLTVRLHLVKILNAVLRCKANIPLLALAKDLYRALGYCYHTVLDAVAHSYSASGIRPHEVGPSFKWQLSWMEVKVGILDVFHGLLERALQEAESSEEGRHKVFDILLSMVDDSPKKPQSAPTTWFGNLPLLVDYQHVYHIKEKLSDLAEGDDAIVDLLLQSLGGLVESHAPREGDAAGALIILLRDLPHTNVLPVIKIEKVDKGKGKAAVQEEEPETDHGLDLAVTQVLDILPDENPTFVKTALQDPTIGRSPEALVAALLEGNLPPPLARIRDGPSEPPVASAPEPASMERRNIFDDEEMDFSRLQFGGTRTGDADTLLNDRSFIDEMKADILRRAQEQQEDSDKEEHHRGPLKDIAFEEDLDDEMAKPTFTMASVDGEQSGEDGEGDEEDDETPHEKNRSSAERKEAPEDILARAYIRDPKLFEKDGATRRSKARADLKAETGWADEQIEGWRLMLERNPQKDRILEKYDPTFNPPSNRDRPVQQAPDRHPQGGGDRGGGGRGRGRGRGRGGGRGGPPASGEGPSSSKDRARKEKYKSSMRQGGHDKKLARGGGPS
ncbi:hypothetical protein FRB90_002745 [Tulasnella sp. 427]|nr:hypothetical protein FRB90_002745 [Tulasnella sp. 427]